MLWFSFRYPLGISPVSLVDEMSFIVICDAHIEVVRNQLWEDLEKQAELLHSVTDSLLATCFKCDTNPAIKIHGPAIKFPDCNDENT